EPKASTGARVPEGYGRLPLSFEANVGQTEGRVDFLARGAGYTLFLTPTEAVMALAGSSSRAGRAEGGNPLLTPWEHGGAAAPSPDGVLGMQVLGGNPAARAVGAEALPGKVNYFLGNDPAQRHTNIPTFGRVAYEGVYPGIDLAYYGSNQQLEYDFVVAPGADPRQIQLGFTGVDTAQTHPGGDLVRQGCNAPRGHINPLLDIESGSDRRGGGRIVIPRTTGVLLYA